MTKIPTIDKREEVIQAMAVGFGLLAQALATVSETTRRAAEALEAVAGSLEEQAEKSNGETGEPGDTGPTGPTGRDIPSQRPPYGGPWDDRPLNP